MAPDALHLADVHTFYADSHILHGVSFSLQPGAVLALLGRNGAGKTTCISTIIGFLKPRDGEIRLFGEPIEGMSPERISQLGIGLVPQGRRIFTSLTVRENLALPVEELGRKSQAELNEMIEQKLAMVGIDAHAAQRRGAQPDPYPGDGLPGAEPAACRRPCMVWPAGVAAPVGKL